MKIKIVSVGEAAVDRYPDHQLIRPGGISLNFAIHAARSAAAAVSLVSAVGNDPYGRLILQALAQHGIDATHVSVGNDPTAWCDILIRANGERYFPPDSYHQNCMINFTVSPAAMAFVRTHDVAMSRFDRAFNSRYFTQIMTDPFFTGKRAADFGSWFDYQGDHDQIFPYLAAADIAFISGDEAAIKALAPPAEAAGTILIVTRGEAGSTAISGSRRIDQPAYPADTIVDTTGAGDAFQAAFVVAYFLHNDLKRALAAGAKRASQTIQHLGATKFDRR